MILIGIVALLWLLRGLPVYAQTTDKEGDITVSLLTCWPGPEVYELCGHEAVRIRGNGLDSVWNYGVFDFAQPNFVYRFVKGETDYMVMGYPYPWFYDEYYARGSKVVEQDLNLTQEEARRLRRMLQKESLPQNRTYRYNYVRDNCATRIVERMDSAFGPVVYTDTVGFPTFREAMRHYHAKYPWYQFGIDLALGVGLDRRITSREEMFVPLVMMRKVSTARLPDGRPLVKESRVANIGLKDATLLPTPWFLTPMFWMCILLVASFMTAIWEWRKGKILRTAYSIFYGAVGIVGIISAFLLFVSEHEATSPNLMIVLFNPMQLIFAVSVWWRKTAPVALVMAVYNVVAVGGLLAMWGLQSQVANPAMFPVMGASVVLSVAYAIIRLGISYSKRIDTNKSK